MVARRLVRSIVALFVLLSASGVTPLAASQLALDTVDSCLKRLNSSADVGYERIAARCPGLARRLQESGWSAQLPQDWRQPGNDLSAGGLRELRQLLLSSTAVERPGGPSTATLPAVLAVLSQQDGAHEGWWARTRAWLREVFERHQDEDDGGLSRLVGQDGVSEAVLELISYVGLTLVVVLALVVVGNELRAAAVIGRWRRWFGRRATPPPSVAVSERAIWGDVQEASLAQQPRLLLERVVARLTAEHRLPSPRGMTVHELTRAARLADETDRERLTRLAWMAERVRFSNDAVADEAIAAVIAEGQSLLARISHYPRDLQKDRSRS